MHAMTKYFLEKFGFNTGPPVVTQLQHTQPNTFRVLMKYASLSFLRKFYLSSFHSWPDITIYHPPVSFSSPTNIHLRNSLACLFPESKNLNLLTM